MRKPLRSLADIRVGYSFRSRIEHDPLGTIRVLQIKDIKGGHEVHPEQLPRMQWPNAGNPPYLATGDIVLPARGDHYDAVTVRGEEPVVASGHLFVLQTRSEAIVPEYLCWYLNQPQAQSYFLSNRAGTSIPMLSKLALGALPVPVPALATQHKVIVVQQLWEREKKLTERLLNNRRRMLEGIYTKLLES